MDGPVSILAQEIAAAGAALLFYDTWAYAKGDPTVSGDTFDDMTARVLEGYTRQARRTGGRVVPVGLAWATARDRGDELWTSDGNHPTRSGTYLAAATFVAVLIGPTVPSAFTAGLPPERALQLQREAAAVAASPSVVEAG
jgi:hypothetical protein